MSRNSMKKNLQDQLTYIGDNPTREGLVGTPDRIIRMWEEDIFRGYKEDIPSLFTIFEEKYDQMVILKDIELYSMCEHHMLPFFGKAHIAYIPNGKVVGISKLARLLDAFARRLQIQERIGDQVVDAIMEHLQPLGAACIIEATHMCMRMRGVKKQNSIMVTSSVRGDFLNNPSVKNEFLQLIQK